MISKCLYAAIPVFLIFSGCAPDISDVMDSSAEIPKDRKLDGHLMASLLILVLIVLEFVYSYKAKGIISGKNSHRPSLLPILPKSF